MLTIKVEILGLDRLKAAAARAPDRTVGEISKAVQESLQRIQSWSIKEAPANKQIGMGARLRASFDWRMTSRIAGELWSRAPYALYVHEGTKPSPGRFVPGIGPGGRGARLINTVDRLGRHRDIGMHPGQKANPFFVRAIKDASPAIAEAFKRAMDNVLQSFK